MGIDDPHHTLAETRLRPRSAGDLERFASLAGAAAVVAYGLSRRSLRGTVLAVAATPFAYRGLSGFWPRITNGRRDRGDTRVALSGDRGVHVRESIVLARPVAEVYRFWRRLENLPRFM